ncbi:chemotaxis protein CheW [Pseudoduganella namucuonensis]|uniref:Chemotaxis signal transduction protein n=1 Tax=Pseudoduganella namucuonensis TaxID=1035707 RepID=A0A1I7LXC8_9BURK|nr:chemotaxis protein CheW [Pseudoduganella namucuonensis]SFV14374.1 Chemotaxis signal transduction protein [Pseudoduganella namucuonensis]
MNAIVDVPAANYLPYMPDVGKCQRSLHELNLMWRIIEASAKMNCPVEAKTILPTMAATRAGFSQLEDELVASLVREKVRHVRGEIATKAQYVIEIVVRNLYERTADVGFLATDRELCAFVAGLDDDVEAMRLRLRAYRAKYTVYDEIILLDLAGNVLVQIDEASPLEGSLDPLIAETLAAEGYVETFRATDLRPSKREALIYSRRVCHPDTGAVVGVLCLCFHFEEEMARIFQTHRDDSERTNMLLLDADNRVIASADPLWIPLGAKVPVNHADAPSLMMFAGREYMVSTYGSPGYQGYPGPAGWQGQVMIPLDVAFAELASTALQELDPGFAEGLLSHARTFCPPLFDIMNAADMIRRVVWNGQVMTAGRDGDLSRLRTILEQISETGVRSNELFAHSIRELFATVLASGLRDSEFVSHLLVDLFDRNLYERANDCRWWALSPELRALLAGGLPDRAERMGRILEYINGLYTVYTSLVVYDRDGAIIAGTGDYGLGAISIDAQSLEKVLALRTEQDYHVTPFAPSPLYGGRPTYVYHAAIRAPGEGGAVIGGIGIVFDAEKEFDAMLRGALAGNKAVHAFFVDREGAIIASSDPARAIGTRLDAARAMASLGNGDSASRFLEHDEHYAIMGCTASHGYREFKVSDGYKADVIGVVIESFGELRDANAAGGKTVAAIESDPHNASGVEFATFFVDGSLFAIAAEHVCEAFPASMVTSVSMGGCVEQVGILALDAPSIGEGGRCIWVFDLGVFVSGQETLADHNAQVIVVKHGGRTIGLLVSELHGVAKFDTAQLISTPLAGQREGMLIKQVIKANEGAVLIQVVDAGFLFDMLRNPEGPEAERELDAAAK